MERKILRVKQQVFFTEKRPVSPALPQQAEGDGEKVVSLKQLRLKDLSTVNNILCYFEHKVKYFKAGALRAYYEQWQSLTSDTEILQMISGQPIEFSQMPCQRVAPTEKLSRDAREIKSISTETEKLLKRG